MLNLNAYEMNSKSLIFMALIYINKYYMFSTSVRFSTNILSEEAHIQKF